MRFHSRSTALLVVLVAGLAATNARCTSSDRFIKCDAFSPAEMRDEYFSKRSQTVLDLRNLHINQLKPDIFYDMGTITHIYLDDSRVDSVLDDSFKPMQGLQLLSLRELKSSLEMFLQSIEKGSIVGVDIGGNFATCSCAYWTTFLRISNSGTRVVNTNKLPFCSWEDINTCSGKTYTLKPKKSDVFEIDVAMPKDNVMPNDKPLPKTPFDNVNDDIMPIKAGNDAMDAIPPLDIDLPDGDLPLPPNDDLTAELTEIEKLAQLSEADNGQLIDDTRYTDENFETFDNIDADIPDTNPFLRGSDSREAVPKYSVDEMPDMPQTATNLKKSPAARKPKPEKKKPRPKQPAPEGTHRDPLIVGMTIFGAIVGVLILILCIMHLVYYINDGSHSHDSFIATSDLNKMNDY